jgi:hypothetical protein
MTEQVRPGQGLKSASWFFLAGTSWGPGGRVRVELLDFDDIGRAEGRELGPKPGKGAVVHHSSGEADFDGLPGDELPPREAVKRKLKEDAPTPPEMSAD